ncbi:ATP binding protein-like [Hirschfeldia incana]|nr:ATP binding protein-like [Hirschfeldia incana]
MASVALLRSLRRGETRATSVSDKFSSASAGGRKTELRLDGVKDIIAVASGKGGVGKSSTAVNLAVALANRFKLKIGLLDADVYGPSVPIMMSINQKPQVNQDMKMIPVENYGVKCMSMGLLVEKDAPIVWRGPMVMSALAKMTRGVDWGDLDVLVVDMPPGTGDAQITISQNLKLSGAVIVSTPQDVALADANRGISMFDKILGLVENMSCFVCPHCNEASFIFGKEGARQMAAKKGLKLIGEIPLEMKIREGSDEGVPVVVSSPGSVVSKAYEDLAQNVVNRLKELHDNPENEIQMKLNVPHSS